MMLRVSLQPQRPLSLSLLSFLLYSQVSFQPVSASFSTGCNANYSKMMLWEEGRDKALEHCIMPLSFDTHKGSSGRIGILGGSARYTGAPFYASMAALHTGADLAYVFCAQEASLPLKCYSPELMVSSVYSATDFDRLVEENKMESNEADILVNKMVQNVESTLDKLHCLVIGPGLGRCPLVFQAVAQIIKACRKLNIYMVLDADALYMLSLEEFHELLDGYHRVILTPNIVEYERLTKNNSLLDSCVIVKKGRFDAILHGPGNEVMVCAETGGKKRSGGIGDILAGTLGTTAAWRAILSQDADADLTLPCWTACCFVKRATKMAFDKHKRAMSARNVLDELGPTIDFMTK